MQPLASLPKFPKEGTIERGRQAAAEAGDIEAAYRLEKELKQLLAETGIRYVVDDRSREETTDVLPDNW